jgi:hypothetical protein
MTQIKNARENGSVNGWAIATISFILISIGFAVLAVWFYTNYTDQKTNVDAKVEVAVAKAKKDQNVVDEAKFAKREKEPNREFVGPEDYGRVTFMYPKTWSVYVTKDAVSGGAFEAYFNPIIIYPLGSTKQFALRVSIQQQDYSRVIAGYEGLIKKGDLISNSISIDGTTGKRMDGQFSTDVRGAAIFFKIRDKTLTIRTDAITFIEDFDALVKTIKFNQ